MKKRLATKEADVTDATPIQNLDRGVETRSVYPTQVFTKDLAIREIAEVAGRIARIGDSDIAQGGTTASKESQHIPNLASGREHRVSWMLFDDR